MKRVNGLVVGLGLLVAGTIGGVAFAATHGSAPQSGTWEPFSAMMGGGFGSVFRSRRYDDLGDEPTPG